MGKRGPQRQIPVSLEDEIQRRSEAGQTTRQIAAWLAAEHQLSVAHTTVGRLLGKRPKKRPSANITRRSVSGEPGTVIPVQPRDPLDRPRCGARKRDGMPGMCLQLAGWGTQHLGRGRCKLHGGASAGAPPGNRNAVRTHAVEPIWLDKLDSDEQERLGAVDTGPLAQVEEELCLLTLRERRMLGELQTLRALASENKLYLLEESDEHHPYFGDSQRTRRINPLERIRQIENGLTQVQGRKMHLIWRKHRLLQDLGEGGEKDALADLVRIIEESPPPAGGAG